MYPLDKLEENGSKTNKHTQRERERKREREREKEKENFKIILVIFFISKMFVFFLRIILVKSEASSKRSSI